MQRYNINCYSPNFSAKKYRKNEKLDFAKAQSLYKKASGRLAKAHDSYNSYNNKNGYHSYFSYDSLFGGRGC